jgi:uncharacterized membrane protein
MSTIERSIEVNVPVRVAYNQWTQFETFPMFMDGVREVVQFGDNRLLWCAEVAGKEVRWQAQIDEQIPDKRIAWHSTSGARNAGCVTFHRIADDRSRIMLQIDYEPEGVIETVGDALGALGLRVQGDLERFKTFIEDQGRATGAWRGEIQEH